MTCAAPRYISWEQPFDNLHTEITPGSLPASPARPVSLSSFWRRHCETRNGGVRWGVSEIRKMPGSGGGQGKREEVTQDQRLELITGEDALGWTCSAGCKPPWHYSWEISVQIPSVSTLHIQKEHKYFLPLANSYANREKLQVTRSCCSPVQVHIKSLLHRHQNMNTSCLGRNASFQIQAGSQTKAGITSNLQEKPSGDTKTDLFLCLLQHICLGWDSRPSPFWQTSAGSVCSWRLLHLRPTHAHSRGSCFTSCSGGSVGIMYINFKYTQGAQTIV